MSISKSSEQEFCRLNVNQYSRCECDITLLNPSSGPINFDLTLACPQHPVDCPPVSKRETVAKPQPRLDGCVASGLAKIALTVPLMEKP